MPSRRLSLYISFFTSPPLILVSIILPLSFLFLTLNKMSGTLSRRFGPSYSLLGPTSSPSSATVVESLDSLPTSAPTYDTNSILTTDGSEYRTLQVASAHSYDFLLSIPPRPNTTYSELGTPVFYVKIAYQPKDGMDVTLIEKNADGPILGFVTLRFNKSNLFGIGPSEATAIFEKLRRISPISHSRYEFQYDFGCGNGGRRKFIWRRRGPRFFLDQPGLELHEIIGWGARGAWGHESPEILATYRGMRWGQWKRNGRLRIKPRTTGERPHEDGEKEGDRWGEWEQLVTLTAMGILEETRRRLI